MLPARALHRAACRTAVKAGEAEVSWWYPGRGQWDSPTSRAARQLCAHCPVANTCRTVVLDAARNGHTWAMHGTWAGLSERTRQSLRRSRRTCTTCGRDFQPPPGGSECPTCHDYRHRFGTTRPGRLWERTA